MRFSTSSLVLASLALSSTTLAAPTPPMPFDSPVPNSPKPDDWTESVRSPRIPRSPMMAAMRVGGQRKSAPRFKRQDPSTPAPDAGDPADADTADAQGLLGGLGDAIDGLLHQVEGVANGLPIIGGLGILSTDGSPDPNADAAPDPSMQKRQSSEPSTPQTPPLPIDQAEAIRQMILQHQQQAFAALQATGSAMPVDPFTLQQRLQALREAQLAGLPMSSMQAAPGALNIQSLLGGLPVAGPFAGNLLGGGGLLSGVEGIAGGLPIVGGLLGSNGLVGGLFGGAQGELSGLLGATGVGGLLGGVTGTANGLLGNVLGGATGGNSQAGILDSILGGGSGGAQAQSAPYPDGSYLHTFVDTPSVPPNTPMPNPLAFGSFAVDGDNLPIVPPASPDVTGQSVAMDEPATPPESAAPTTMAPTESAPVSAPEPTTSMATPSRRRVDGDTLVPSKRSDCNEDAMHEGGCDAVPGPQDALTKTMTAPRQKKMIRRRLRGLSLGFQDDLDESSRFAY